MKMNILDDIVNCLLAFIRWVQAFLPLALSRLSCTFLGSFMVSISNTVLLITAVIECILQVPTFRGNDDLFLSRCHIAWVLVLFDTAPNVFASNSYIQALTEPSLLFIKSVFALFLRFMGVIFLLWFVLHIRSVNQTLFMSNWTWSWMKFRARSIRPLDYFMSFPWSFQLLRNHSQEINSINFEVYVCSF